MKFDPVPSTSMGIYSDRGLINSIISGNQIIGPKNEGIDLRAAGGGKPVSNNVISNNYIEADYVGICINQAAGAATPRGMNNVRATIWSRVISSRIAQIWELNSPVTATFAITLSVDLLMAYTLELHPW
jgi:hypothetical protein